MTEAYQSGSRENESSLVLDSLEAYVRGGARQMLAAALDDEVRAFLGRDRYERGKPFRGYRNGYHERRELTVGVGAVDVRVPRVAGVPAELAPEGYRSQIVQRYQRASAGTQELFARLYLEGLATGDFEPVFRELVGETTALSANAVVRLKERWADEYTSGSRRNYVGIEAPERYCMGGAEHHGTHAEREAAAADARGAARAEADDEGEQ
jgi:transposase-like protein